MSDSNLTFSAEEVVRAMYRGLLGRNADRNGLTTYVNSLEKDRDLTNALRGMLDSEEFQRRRTPGAWRWPNPTLKFHESALVFLHIQKTAGTSLQQMLTESFGAKNVFTSVEDTLHLHCPGELSTYSVFSGHFNYDSLRYIPRANPSVITFVRDPKQRLLSLYYHWRSHEPTHPNYKYGPHLANQMTLSQFFGSDRVVEKMAFGVWNHMTWVIMGQDQWTTWYSQLYPHSKAPSRQFVDNEIRPLIRQRLDRLFHVGLQEDFENSVAALFAKLNRPVPTPRKENVTDRLGADDSRFKSNFIKESPTQETTQLLDRLVILDQVIFEEANELNVFARAQSTAAIQQAR